jgi:hypothetical protein
MHNPHAPRSIQRDILVQVVGEETVLYDEVRKEAFCLNETSSVVWQLADGQKTVAQIGELLSVRFQIEISQSLVLFALQELRKRGLLEQPLLIETTHVVSRRSLLRALGPCSALLIPSIAAIVAPTAAQAYNGCVDCPSSSATQAARANQLARIRRQQLNASGIVSPTTNSFRLSPSPPRTDPVLGPPTVPPRNLQR